MWAYAPMHPAAFDESNVRYVLSTPEGGEEKSPLSLSVYVALCLGILTNKNHHTLHGEVTN